MFHITKLHKQSTSQVDDPVQEKKMRAVERKYIILFSLDLWRNENGIHENSHSTLFGVDIILLNIPRHPKVCHLTFLSFANKNISGCQVTMDYLKEIKVMLNVLKVLRKIDNTIPFSE